MTHRSLLPICLAMCGCLPAVAVADSGRCERLSAQSAAAALGFHPSVESRVVHPTGAVLRVGPHRRCKALATLPPQSYVTAYSSDKGWMQVGALVNKDLVIGWVVEKEVKLIAPHGTKHPSRPPAASAPS